MKLHRTVLPFVLLGATVAAQNEVDTLARATERADWIAVVEVRGDLADDGIEHSARFSVLRSLRGTGPASFVLREPCGHACGRALHGVAAGSRFIALLARDGDATRLLHGNARSLVPLDDEVLQHVQALLGAATASDRLSLLTNALQSSQPRIRRDAAATLPQLAELERASLGDRQRIVAALGPACRQADVACVGLTRAAERLQLRAALDTLVDCYLGDTQPRLAPLFLDAIPRIDADRAAELVEASLPASAAGRGRAVRLLACLPGAVAQAALLRLARTADADFATAVSAGAALLTRGMAPAVLQSNTTAQLVQAASRRAAAPGHRFRSIFQGNHP